MALALFYLLGLVTLGGAVGVVTTRNVVHATLFLLLSLMGIAGIYVLLFAEFLALVQVLIYGGAIIIVLLFALMLTRLQEFGGPMEHRQWPLAALGALAMFGLLVAALLRGRVPPGELRHPDFEERFVRVGQTLFGQWAVPFEVASVLLLVALLGAIIVARAGGRE